MPSCELNAAGLTPAATAYVLHVAFGVLLVCTAIRCRAELGLLTSLTFGCIGSAAIVLQRGILDIRSEPGAGFRGVLVEAQQCMSTSGGTGILSRGPEWTDGSSVWLFNVPFALIWAGAASWGCLALVAPSSDGLGTIALPQSLGSPLWRSLCCVPSVGTLYALVFLVGGGSLIKPLSSQLYFYEPLLATILTLSGLPWLAVAIGGPNLIKVKTWSKVPLTRVAALLIGVSASYYCVWRLNGGLVLSAEQWAPDAPLRRAFEATNGQPHSEWQHVGLLRSAAKAMGAIGLIKA